MRTRIGILLAFAAALFVFGSVAHARKWTDQQGRKIDATFARLDGNTVVLQQGLKVLRVPLDSLSADDQEFIRKQTEKRRPGEKPANGPATPADPAGGALKAERTWTDNSGRTTRGRFEQMVGTNTVQLKIDGQSTFLQVSRLSQADQQFLRDQGAIPAEPVAVAPGFPPPPQIPGVPGFPRPVIVPPMYPPPGGGLTALEGPRWWHAKEKMLFGRLSRIDWHGVQVLRTEVFVTRFSFDELAASDAAHALEFPSKEGLAAFVEKVRSANPSAFAGTSPQQAASPSLPESDLTNSESREWHNGFETFTGHLLEADTVHVKISGSTPGGRRIAYSDMFTGDREWLLAFLARHGAEPIAAKVREAGEASRLPSDFLPTQSEARQWNVRGQDLEAQIVLMAREGIELRDTGGKHHRKTYKDMSDAERSYLVKYVQGKPDLRNVEGWIASGIAPPAANPSFFGPPPSPPPGFPSAGPGPDFGPRFVPQPTPFQPPTLQPPSIPSGPTGMVGQCGNCKRIVSGSIKPGDKCPHCGVTFDVVENADGSKSYSNGYFVGQVFGVAIFVIAVIFGIARRFG